MSLRNLEKTAEERTCYAALLAEVDVLVRPHLVRGGSSLRTVVTACRMTCLDRIP